jgi:hypothetical protein
VDLAVVTPYLRTFVGRPSRAGRRRVYRYVHRPGYPRVRVRAEPGSLEFDAVYVAVMRATSLDEVIEMRRRLGMQVARKLDWSRADAVIAWAERRVAARRRRKR